MANFSATIAVAEMDLANKLLEAQGFGPGNFGAPIADVEGEEAKHAGLHCWDVPAFRAALVDLQATCPSLTIADASDGKPNFDAVCAVKGWSQARDVESWFVDPVLKGTVRTDKGKTWESLVDYNIWPPGVAGWREVVAVGFPDWRQPTGAQDAYKIGDKVRFEGADWESVIAANVWSPVGFPAGWRKL